ncbi:MAG: dihydrodipicolinate reductase C-terminal domain-containing protein [Acidobacteriaceae bacterium]|jgi:4-hydroxy-tetrahydrodipicolinate reductase
MRILVLGQGKTGKLVAEVAAARGHGVHVLDAKENPNAAALTPPFVAGFDVVIDFTAPEAVVQNMRAVLATGGKMVIGTTGWYNKLADMRALAERKGAGLLYGTNFSIAVQVMMKLAQQMGASLAGASYRFSVLETHHVSKLDKPSGTALSIVEMVQRGAGNKIGVPIESVREGDAMGTHVLEAASGSERLLLTHEAMSRRGFAEGAVRAAEWLAKRTGCYDFRDVYAKL